MMMSECRIPEEFRHIPEKVENMALRKIIDSHAGVCATMMRRIDELEEKNAILKGTLARVMRGEMGDA
jgi:hypothetical protein